MLNSVLVGDVGGTNIRFAVAQAGKDGLTNLRYVWRSPANDFENFGDALEHFLKITPKTDHPAHAVFAFAGPVDNNSVSLTNRAWTLRRDDLISRFGFERLVFMNDFAAMARSIPELPETAFSLLQEGEPASTLSPRTTLAVAGAGTGLGQALLMGDKNSGWTVFPTEGGHQPFAPITPYESEIHSLLRKTYGYVSFELICSGRGLVKVYHTIAQIQGRSVSDLTASDITERAKISDSLAIDTCEFAANSLMSFIGNAVLSSGAWNGAVIAGGVSQHLHPYLSRPEALARFNEKGQMQARMARVPLRILIDQTAPLIGAASSS